MFRISQTQGTRGSVLLLEGKLLEPWVGELRDAVATLSAKTPVEIDLSGLSYADPAGALLLATLARAGALLKAPSPLVKALLAAAID